MKLFFYFIEYGCLFLSPFAETGADTAQIMGRGPSILGQNFRNIFFNLNDLDIYYMNEEH